MLARAAALIVLVLYVAGIAANRWLDRRIGPGGGNPVEDAIVVVGFGLFALVGAVLVARRPGNLIGWILSVASLVVLASALETYAAYVMTTRGRPDWLAVVGAWANSWYWFVFLALVFVYLPLLFPDGRLPSRRWLPVAVVPGIGLVSMVVLGALVDTLRGQDIDYRIDNPIGIEGLAHVENLPVIWVFGGFYVLGSLGAVASLAVRFRRSRGIERQQLKWFLFAAAPVPIAPFLDSLSGIIGALAFTWVLLGLPVAIGVAVLKHRLYDIDLVINRTLVYGSLTAMLALVYFGGVAGLQRLLSPVVGEGNGFAVVASTLLIAALFQPLRRRVQGFIDRRFYRNKYDARKTLEEFGDRLRDGTELENLVDELVEVVHDTMRPTRVSLWLRESERSPGRGPE
jgi:hypothetical protein